jgi:hypothetical protein
VENAKTPVLNQSITINGGTNGVIFGLNQGSTIFFGASKSFIYNGNLSFALMSSNSSIIGGSSNTLRQEQVRYTQISHILVC